MNCVRTRLGYYFTVEVYHLLACITEMSTFLEELSDHLTIVNGSMFQYLSLIQKAWDITSSGAPEPNASSIY